MQRKLFLLIQSQLGLTLFFVIKIHLIYNNNSIFFFSEWIPHSDITEEEHIPHAYFQSQGIWITVTTLDNENNNKLPKLYSVYSLGCLYTTSCYMVQYKPVDTDKLRSISLANNNKNYNINSDSNNNSNNDINNNKNQSKTINKGLKSLKNLNNNNSNNSSNNVNNNNEDRNNYYNICRI